MDQHRVRRGGVELLLTMSTMGTTARGNEIEEQRRYSTPCPICPSPAEVEDGAELDVARAAKEIELSNLRRGWA